jgi:hypothetical protein
MSITLGVRVAGYPREEPGAGKPYARICAGKSRMAELLDHNSQDPSFIWRMRLENNIGFSHLTYSPPYLAVPPSIRYKVKVCPRSTSFNEMPVGIVT